MIEFLYTKVKFLEVQESIKFFIVKDIIEVDIDLSAIKIIAIIKIFLYLNKYFFIICIKILHKSLNSNLPFLYKYL